MTDFFPPSFCAVFRRLRLCLCCLAALVAGAAWAADKPPVPTTIESESMEMQGAADRNFFTFHGRVKVLGENLEITCDHLEVVTGRSGDPNATIGQLGTIYSIVATGQVRIVQSGRQALAGKAVMDPRAGLLTLTDNPRILDGDTTVSGREIVLDRKKNVRIKDGKTVLGGNLPKFNFDREPPPPPPAPVPEWIGDTSVEGIPSTKSPAPARP